MNAVAKLKGVRIAITKSINAINTACSLVNISYVDIECMLAALIEQTDRMNMYNDLRESELQSENDVALWDDEIEKNGKLSVSVVKMYSTSKIVFK